MSVPVININLKPCTCRSITPYGPASIGECLKSCEGAPVLIPCPIPRSVTFDVVIADCAMGCAYRYDAPGTHSALCPARPIRVSCSISGSTWEESEVADVEQRGALVSQPSRADATLVAACRARWALVKALVLGAPMAGEDTAEHLFAQRNDVFAALAKASRAEDALNGALGDYEEAMRGEPVGIYGLKRESHGALERYVGRLIEQVGALQ